MSTYDPQLANDFFRVHTGPVNKSTSKQLYTFAKADRFRNKDLSK
jgi:hypothetical protein